MDADGVGGNADVVDGLQVGNPVEEGVALHHAAVRDRPEGRRERQRFLGEVDLEDVVVRTGAGLGSGVGVTAKSCGRKIVFRPVPLNVPMKPAMPPRSGPAVRPVRPAAALAWAVPHPF